MILLACDWATLHRIRETNEELKEWIMQDVVLSHRMRVSDLTRKVGLTPSESVKALLLKPTPTAADFRKIEKLNEEERVERESEMEGATLRYHMESALESKAESLMALLVWKSADIRWSRGGCERMGGVPLGDRRAADGG